MALSPIVFDAYGTLFDPLGLAEPLERRFPGRGRELAAVWRATQLRHTWLRSLMGAWVDFDAVTADAVHQTLIEAGAAPDAGLAADILAAYRALPPYPDAADMLAALVHDRPRAVLTNGNRRTVEATIDAAGFADALPVVLSAEDVRVYKPSPDVYALATSHFGVGPAEVTFVSGNAWDCAGAAAFGFQVVRVRRGIDAHERVGPLPAAVVDDLRDLLALLR